MKTMDLTKFHWRHAPKNYLILEDKIVIETEKATGLWSKTRFNTEMDNAPMFLTELNSEEDFTFTCKVEFDFKKRYDQCGLVCRFTEKSWCRFDVEKQDEERSMLSVVNTFHDYSDWSGVLIGSGIKHVYLRISRQKEDYLLQFSLNGQNFKQIRMFHQPEHRDKIELGIYAGSPNDSWFDVTFSELTMQKCLWVKE